MKNIGTTSFRVGAILAGGKSKRMGRAKAGVRLPNGLSFAEQACQILTPHVDEIVLLGHAEGAPKALPRIDDASQCEGPISGLLALLRSGKAREYIVLSCDMPFLSTELIALLLREIPRRNVLTTEQTEGASRQVQPPRKGVLGTGFRDAENATLLPFPLWLHQDALAAVESFVSAGENRWMRMLAAMPIHWIVVSASEAHQFRNVNCPQDLPWTATSSGSG